MATIGRRATSLMFGLGILAQEMAFGAIPAEAWSYTQTTKQCTRWGGQALPEADPKNGRYLCIIPRQLDKKCAKLEKGGQMYEFDAMTGKCKKCFLTTACVENLGLEDDCFELQALRRFRDGPLQDLAGGQQDIERYYRVAPRIVAQIMGAPDPRRELDRLYARYVLPSAILATIGAHRLAYRLYKAMMQDLEARYA